MRSRISGGIVLDRKLMGPRWLICGMGGERDSSEEPEEGVLKSSQLSRPLSEIPTGITHDDSDRYSVSTDCSKFHDNGLSESI